MRPVGTGVGVGVQSGAQLGVGVGVLVGRGVAVWTGVAVGVTITLFVKMASVTPLPISTVTMPWEVLLLTARSGLTSIRET
jgi:hypothetical protein